MQDTSKSKQFNFESPGPSIDMEQSDHNSFDVDFDEDDSLTVPTAMEFVNTFGSPMDIFKQKPDFSDMSKRGPQPNLRESMVTPFKISNPYEQSATPLYK